MGKRKQGVIALAVGVAIFSSGPLAAGAQDDEGPNEVEAPVAAGTLDDGADLLPQAGISLEVAIAAAQNAASGAIAEIDLEYLGDILVYNIDVGTQDVKVDAATGAVLAVDAED
jgi:uncharacterized membrane protein YkoI